MAGPPPYHEADAGKRPVGSGPGLWEPALACGNLLLTRPVGYHDLLRLNMGAAIMLTDSGGLQEECCVLGTPCLTLRGIKLRIFGANIP
jgi:hypothetical protein